MTEDSSKVYNDKIRYLAEQFDRLIQIGYNAEYLYSETMKTGDYTPEQIAIAALKTLAWLAKVEV